MAELKHGCLVVADIGGSTRFVAGVELEHSQDLLADLLGAVAARGKGAFESQLADIARTAPARTMTRTRRAAVR